MGYQTDYTIEAGPFESYDQAEFFEFKLGKQIGYHVEGAVGHNSFTGNVDDAKWYEWQKDLAKLARAFPDITIDVEGVGEEAGDQWKARFRNTEFEKVKAIITYPEFTKLI